MAQVRFSNGSAQDKSCSTWRVVARTLTIAIWSSSRPMATAVCDALCGSIPIITFISASLVVGTTGALLLADCRCSILF